MHEFIFSGISSQRYSVFDRNIDFQKGIQKPVFKTENRISVFKPKTGFPVFD